MMRKTGGFGERQVNLPALYYVQAPPGDVVARAIECDMVCIFGGETAVGVVCTAGFNFANMMEPAALGSSAGPHPGIGQESDVT